MTFDNYRGSYINMLLSRRLPQRDSHWKKPWLSLVSASVSYDEVEVFFCFFDEAVPGAFESLDLLGGAFFDASAYFGDASVGAVFNAVVALPFYAEGSFNALNSTFATATGVARSPQSSQRSPPHRRGPPRPCRIQMLLSRLPRRFRIHMMLRLLLPPALPPPPRPAPLAPPPHHHLLAPSSRKE